MAVSVDSGFRAAGIAGQRYVEYVTQVPHQFNHKLKYYLFAAAFP